jgi:polyisoprenoid-binding protein YceI
MLLRQTGVWLVAVCTLALANVVRGDLRDFDFKDPKGVNAMTFFLDSLQEPIVGVASDLSGTVKFDPAKPESTTGRLVVQAASLHVPTPKMKEVLHSPGWLDVQKFPEISYVFKEVNHVSKPAENTWELQVSGDFTCHGVTKPLKVLIKVSYLPGKLGDRVPKMEGDLLVLRAEFSIKRSDFGINPNTPAAVVAEEIQIRAGIVGAWQKK